MIKYNFLSVLTDYRKKFGFTFLSWICVLTIAGFNLILASQVSPNVPIVDGWAVLNRVMHFDMSEMTWDQYLFRPHGAHLHSLVYFVTYIDNVLFDGNQIVSRALSWISILACLLFFVNFLTKEGLNNNKSLSFIVLVSTVMASLMTSLVDQDALLLPFQVVISGSRFAYVMLLWGAVWSICNKRHYIHLFIVSLSLVAVTFHGAGNIFAICMVFLHLFIWRGWRYLILGFTPLFSVVLFQIIYSQGGGELSQLGSLFNARAMVEFFPAFFAYFAMPLLSLEPWLSYVGLNWVGAVVFLILLSFAHSMLMNHMGGRFRRFLDVESEFGKYSYGNGYPRVYESIFYLLLFTFLCLSAAASSLFWIVRTVGTDPGLHPYYMVYGSTRNTVFSTFGYFLLCVYALRWKGISISTQRWRLNVLVWLIFSVVLIQSLLGSIYVYRNSDIDDKLNRAIAGISSGLKSTHPEVDAVWPGAKDDWYWVTELQKTMEYMRQTGKGIWSSLPAMNVKLSKSNHIIPINDLSGVSVKSENINGISNLNGNIFTWGKKINVQSLLLPVVDGEGYVKGYAVVDKSSSNASMRHVDGFVAGVPGINNGFFLTAFNITDVTWLNGFSRNGSAFFIKYSEEIQKKLMAGTKLKFFDGSTRFIRSSERNGPYLNIFLNGSPIDGLRNGYPNPISVNDSVLISSTSQSDELFIVLNN